MAQADRPSDEMQGRLLGAHRRHDRQFQDSRYVYPVLSRRSRGISVGINLNPDRRCNFDCVYCQVQRTDEPATGDVDVAQVMQELKLLLDLVKTGQLFDHEPFRDVPEPLRKLKDVAFSGDGEPTTCRQFAQVAERVVQLLQGTSVKPILITNASQLHRPEVKRGTALIVSSGGEVWGKLDAGTEAYYQRVNRCATPFERILENLADQAKAHPLVIQSLFMRLAGEGPDDREIAAYCERLNQILQAGGRIDRVQIHSLAREPAEAFVTPLEASNLEAIGEQLRRLTGLRTDVHGEQC